MKQLQASLMASWLLIGCMANDPPPIAMAPAPAEPPSTRPTSLAPATATSTTPPDEPFSDAEITRAVQRELQHADVVGRGVRVRTTRGIVELTGTAEHLLAKERATSIAMTVKGVRSVSNRIDVRPAERKDAEIRRDIEQTLFDNPAADSYEIDVSVMDGVAILRGKVQSFHEKRLTEHLAKRVKGVRQVTNQIDVVYPSQRSDPEIANDVKSRLEWDALVPDASLIGVSVKDGRVKLSGAVGSAAQRARAISDGWVAGVKGVDASSLVVHYQRASKHRRDQYGFVKSDPEIAEAIELAASYDPRVSSFDVQPEVNGGVVRLRGTVDNLGAKRAAEQLAKNTVGVRSVINQIEVAAGGTIEDGKLESRIESGLLLHPITDSYQIDVDVKDGNATLRGTVETFTEKAEAEDVAQSFTGVRSVNNQLQVRSASLPFLYDPYDPFHPDIGSWEMRVPAVATARGEELEDRVEDEILWDPHVDAWQVRVDARGSEVILRGTVDSLFESSQAVLNAFEAGATAVDNRLSVR